MPISLNFESILVKDFKINFTQCLPNQTLKITELCNMLQLVASEHAELGGISFVDMQHFDQAWVLSRMRIELTELPKWNDTIQIKTWIVSLENSRSIRAFYVFLNKKIIVCTETSWAVFNTKTRRPENLALPHDHFEKYNFNFATTVRPQKINFDVSPKKLVTKKIVLSDLDIVNHVNNIKYLEWCLDLLPANRVLLEPIKTIELNFNTELLLYDEVSILNNNQNKTSNFLIQKKDKNACLITFGF